MLKKLVPLGLKVEQSVVRDKLGLPDPPEGAELLTAPSQPIPAGQLNSAKERRSANRTFMPVKTGNAVGSLLAAGNVEEGSRDSLDDLVDEALSDWESIISPVLDPIQKAAEEAESFEEFMNKLYAAYDTMDLSETQRKMAVAQFIARGIDDATDEVNI